MGRKRKTAADQQLPPDTYRGKTSFEWRPKGDNGRRKTITLCPLSTPIDTVWATWLERKNSDQSDTLRWLLDKYMGSAEFARKAVKTRSEQERQARHISNYPTGPGRTFGDAKLYQITPGIMRRYLDARADAGAGVAGNREKALISKAWNWARERDLTKAPNPCKDVERNTETRRQRYVTDAEYQAVYQTALSYPRDTLYYRIAIAMELAYLCRLRRIEVLTATRAQVLDEGFDTQRAKRGRAAITGWSDRLRAAVAAALETHGPIPSTYLLSNGRAGPIAEEGFKTAWQRVMQQAVDKHGIEWFTFHDLRRKGTTDFEGSREEKQDAGGWNSAAVLPIYDVSKPKTKPTR